MAAIAAFGAARSATAVGLTPLLGPGDFLFSPTTTVDFEDGIPDAPPLNTSQITFEPTTEVDFATSWTGGVTPSGLLGLVETFNDEPMTFVFTVPVREVGMFFGNDEFAFGGGHFNAILEVFDAANSSLGSVQVASNANDFADQYIGVRSDTAIKSAAISYQRPEADTFAVYIDDLKVGGLVPEPSGLALAACGVLWLAAGVRRICPGVPYSRRVSGVSMLPSFQDMLTRLRRESMPPDARAKSNMP
jgi:hypothetical protein